MLEKDPKAPRQHPYLTRKPPAISETLARRQAGQDPRVIEIAWRAQRRLHQRLSRSSARCTRNGRTQGCDRQQRLADGGIRPP
jgi:hypothetical protein